MAEHPIGDDPPSLAGADWLVRPETVRVFSALEAGGAEARAVGGAVRNALAGRPVKDIDIATTARPEEVVHLAERAGLKPVPTGLAHGTVTVISGHVPYEVTSLRRDVETFGRHAVVAYTEDWTEDALRRDFTINALYARRDGRVFDPVGGWPDIKARRVRFIGAPEDRIREDYLRILRFFRFTASFADGAADTAGLEAARRLAHHVAELSGERVRAELLRLMEATHAAEAANLMAACGVAGHVLPVPADPTALARLQAIEHALSRPPDPLLRLAAFSGGGPGAALRLRERLKLSNQETERLSRLLLPDPALKAGASEAEAKGFIYRFGREAFEGGLMLAWAKSGAGARDPHWRTRLRLARDWPPPGLPIRGADVVALGVPAGPEVGRIVARFEEWWIGAGFPADAALLAAQLASLVKVTKT